MRLKAFINDTPTEHLPQEVDVPGEEWPSKRQLGFRDLTAKYR